MDYYKVLEISITATVEEIKQSYKRLALKYHPDRANGNADNFIKLTEAYRVLLDPASRARYNQQLLESTKFSKKTQLVKTVIYITESDLENLTAGSTIIVVLDKTSAVLEIPYAVQNNTTVQYKNILPNLTLEVRFCVTNF